MHAHCLLTDYTLKQQLCYFFSLSASFLLIAMLNMVVCVKDCVKNNSK